MIPRLSESKSHDYYIIILKSQIDYLIRNFCKIHLPYFSAKKIAGVGVSKMISSMKTKQCSGVIVFTDQHYILFHLEQYVFLLIRLYFLEEVYVHRKIG